MLLSLLVALARHDLGPVAVALALLVLPQLPTALVPFLPTRYTALPYQGFLLILALGVALLWRAEHGRGRDVTLALAAVFAFGVFAAGAATVRADLEDVGRASAAHLRLLTEARAVIGEFPAAAPVLVARAEREYPLREVAREFKGTPKLYYPRGRDAYALADTAAVFEWVDGREDVFFSRFDHPSESPVSAPGAVLLHRVGGFDWRAVGVRDLSPWAAQLTSSGVPFHVVVALGFPR